MVLTIDNLLIFIRIASLLIKSESQHGFLEKFKSSHHFWDARDTLDQCHVRSSPLPSYENVSFNFFSIIVIFPQPSYENDNIFFFFTFFTPFPINEGFDSSNFHNFTFSSPRVWEYENVTFNVFYLVKLIIPKRKRRILFCNNHYFDQQKSVSHLLKIVYFYPPAK